MSIPNRPMDLIDLPGVAAAVEAARSDLAHLHRHPTNRRGWPQTSAAASVRAARASAVLDGGDAAVDPDSTNVTDPVLAGALRVAAALGGLAPVWSRSPLQVLARLHTLAAADLAADQETLGRPVRGAERLTALAGLVTGSGIPGPVQVAVVHAELLTSRPFGVADGVVARAAARLTSISTGLDRRGLGVPEVAQLRAGSAYLQLAQGYAGGDPDAVGAWIRVQCDWLQAGAREGASIADAAG